MTYLKSTKNLLVFVSLLVFISPDIIAQSRFGDLLPDSAIYSLTSLSNNLYVGIDNNIKLNLGDKIKGADTILLKCNNGIVFDDDKDGYIIIPKRPGTLRIEIHKMIGENIDTIGFYQFNVLPLPKPKVLLDSTIIHEDVRISTETFLNSDSIYIILSDDIPGSKKWIEINEFSIGYNYGSFYIEEKSNDNAITDAMKVLVVNNGAGRTFTIKLITESNNSLFSTKPTYKTMFY